MFKNLLIAVFAGTLLGVGGAFAAEMLDQRVRSSEALSDAIGLPVLIQFNQKSESNGLKRWLKKFRMLKVKTVSPKMGKAEIAV
jgi:hypothetical protein